MTCTSRLAALVLLTTLAAACGPGPTVPAVSERPDTPFKLATFEADGQTRLGMVLGTRILDIAGANQQLTTIARLGSMPMPGEMRELIEQYATLSPRLYQIANYFGSTGTDTLPFAYDEPAVTFQAPIKYPWNLLAAAANYKLHAEGMAPPVGGAAASATPAPAARPAGGFDASAAARIVPARDAPIMFAKSPRSCIIDPGQPFYIVDGRQRTDYEGEMAIIMGPRPAYRIPREQAHDYVFGYSIAQDISDRGSERLRVESMFPGTNWFDGKSIEGAAPFGPVIVPKEFLPQAPGNLQLVTKLNGQVVQDASTDQLIWDEAHLVAYLSSRLTLHPGDVILTGTPAGTGMERQVFVKPGDVVTVEIEGIGTLTTPFKALSEKQ